MPPDSDDKRRPRRPRHDRDRGRDRDRDGPRDPAEMKERMDRDFEREIDMRISYFLQSDESELELEPMNSYRRRMVHTLAKKYDLTSESRGEDRDRFVCLVKTGATPKEPESKVRLWDFGRQTFPVNPGAKGIHMALKVDGSVELFRASERAHTLADRLVTSREFRIRQGKIVQPDEPGY